MYKKQLILAATIAIFTVSCNNGSSDNGSNRNANCTNIEVAGNINRLLQIDSIFSGFTAIPLETRIECLMIQILIIRIQKGKMFLQDKRKSLFVFDTNGKFLHGIGKMGKGPGEYFELRNFDIDKNGNIYILDFRKILMYNNNGAFIK
jgi:hypothetical protein